MNIENTKSQLRKGVLEYCILEILSKKKAYASTLLEELKGVKIIVVEGTLYPLLTRLKNAGMLSYSWEESQLGPPRKYYELSDNGKLLLVELKETWSEIVTAVEQIKELK